MELALTSLKGLVNLFPSLLYMFYLIYLMVNDHVYISKKTFLFNYKPLSYINLQIVGGLLYSQSKVCTLPVYLFLCIWLWFDL